MKIRDASGWTIFIFGVLAFLLGLMGLIRPEILLSILGFEVIDRAMRASSDYTIVFMTASSMASLNIGIYYVLAALPHVDFHRVHNLRRRWNCPDAFLRGGTLGIPRRPCHGHRALQRKPHQQVKKGACHEIQMDRI